MKYKDYYDILGVARDADDDAIKKAYRRLARKFHPDVSKEPHAEDRFKEIGEAYKTLKDPEQRAAYDRLGRHASGQEFQPPPDWGTQFGGTGPTSFDDIDLADLFESLRGAARRPGHAGGGHPMPGRDYELAASITLEQAYHGTELDMSLTIPEYDAGGMARRVPHTFKVRIPKGATDGQKLRVPGKGGKGLASGANGDLYLDISIQPHPLYRVSGHDLYLDLPLAPWEAALGAAIEVPTLGGAVLLKVPPVTSAGRHLRLAGRGLPKPGSGAGDLFAIVQIAMPPALGERERALFKELGELSGFNPRAHLERET